MWWWLVWATVVGAAPCSSPRLHLAFETELLHAVYSTPVVFPVHPAGRHQFQILTASVANYVELVNDDGTLPPGWPVHFPETTFLSAPLVVDCDHSGRNDVMVVSSTGMMTCFSVSAETGLTATHFRALVPPLSVKEDWFVGLDEEAAHRNYHAHAKSAGFVHPLADHEYATQDTAPKPPGHGVVHVPAHVVGDMVLSYDLLPSSAPAAVVSVSYYFDEEQGEVQDNAEKYVSGGVAVLDVHSQRWLWRAHLDLSTDHADATAVVYSAPTIADLEGDGHLEVVVATKLGFVYVLEGATGDTRAGFPAALGWGVEYQVIAADVMGEDGHLEIVVAGEAVVVIGLNGHTEWTAPLPSPSLSGVAVGDVTGDGLLSIVVPTQNGDVLAFDGNGKPLDGFPLATEEKIMAPLSLVVLEGNTHSIVAASHDGNVYLWDAARCPHKVDIGEHVYAQVVPCDLQGDGMIELVVGTLNGHMTMLRTSAPYLPGTAQWFPSSGMPAYGATHRVVFVKGGEVVKYTVGAPVPVEYEIVDTRRGVHPAQRAYTVRILAGSVVVHSDTQVAPGVYATRVTLDNPTTAVLHLVVTNEHGHVWHDVMLVDFDASVYASVPWLITIPLVILTAARLRFGV